MAHGLLTAAGGAPRMLSERGFASGLMDSVPSPGLMHHTGVENVMTNYS